MLGFGPLGRRHDMPLGTLTRARPYAARYRATRLAVPKQRSKPAGAYAASILAPLTVSQCANCLLWTSYGVFAAKDVFVWGPNGVGLALGLAQLALKLCFPSKDDDYKYIGDQDA